MMAPRPFGGSKTNHFYIRLVITHIKGMFYTGSPSTDQWSESGNNGYQWTLQWIWQ